MYNKLLQHKWRVEGVAMGAHIANDMIDKERTEGAIAAVGCAGKWFYGLQYHPENSKKARILKLRRRNLKSTVLTSNTPYPSRKIRCICACTSQETTKNKGLYAVKMDDPNITMEVYIRLEEEKARRRGKVYTWETATYGNIWYDEDVHDLRSVETEFPAIVYNDALTSEVLLSCEPTVSPLDDNQIDFRISFDESDDEEYTVVVGLRFGAVYYEAAGRLRSTAIPSVLLGCY
ncbi:hypothetical protein Tco_0639801 [Tanacetum coccineum]